MSPKRKNDSDSSQHKNKIVGFILLIVVLIGGIWFFAYQRADQASSAEIITLASSPLDTVTPPSNASDNTDVTPVCFWNWATNNASSEHIEALHDALDNAGIEAYELIASAYGEDKICQRGDEIVSSSFYMMDITPTITLTVASETLADSTALGAQLRQIATALEASESLPKINRLEINFMDETDSIRWIASYNEVTQAIANDMSDDDLYALGQG